MTDSQQSIFQKFYSEQPFNDRYQKDKSNAVEVIIPIIHTNELWKTNLLSIYREIPVKRLLIADGGCVDNSLEIAKEFPRVTIFDHTNYISLGYSLRKLIEEVETDWFVYLHSDVFLPNGWFDTMFLHKDQYSWYESRQRNTILVDYERNYDKVSRPYSGGQLGATHILQQAVETIDDDYLYRNEDIIIADLVQHQGYTYGRVMDTHLYHQNMHKPSKWQRDIVNVHIELDLGEDEEIRAMTMQVKGIIKYMQPPTTHLATIIRYTSRLYRLDQLNQKKFYIWIEETNPAWLPYIKKAERRQHIKRKIKRVVDTISKFFRLS
jgi:glycosyltransferase involved in cell wall biosynthesis